MTPTTPSLPFFERFKQEHTGRTPPPPEEPETPKPEESVLSPPMSEFSELPYPGESDDGDKDAGSVYSKDDDDTATETPEVVFSDTEGAPSALTYPGDTDDDDEGGGLAYADDDDETSTIAGTEKPEPKPEAKVRFPSIVKTLARADSASSSSSSTTSPTSPRVPPMRSLSQSTTYTVRSAAKSTGALDRSMETVFEEGAMSPTTPSASSPTLGPDFQRDSMRPKLPMRSHTSPGLSSKNRPDSRASTAGKKKSPKVKQCLKCNKTIDDGRWIRMEGGGVMCGECWKNMYLPKVGLSGYSRRWEGELTSSFAVPALQQDDREAGRFVLGRSAERKVPQRMF